jgi:hypothetical protein
MGSIDDIRDMEVMEELSSTLEEKAARKIQSVLRTKIQRGKAMDELCDAMLEGASEAGLSFNDILSRRSHSDVLDDILSHHSDPSAVSCHDDVLSDILSNSPYDANGSWGESARTDVGMREDVDMAAEKDNEVEEKARMQKLDLDGLIRIRERRAASRIVHSLQLYRQRIHAASVIQRHLRDNNHFRRKVAERRIVRQLEFLLDRRRRWQRTIKKASGG